MGEKWGRDLGAAGTGEWGVNKIKIHCIMYEILKE